MTTPRLDLTGIVGDDINAATVKQFLAANAGAPVEMDLNSPGGSVFAGIEMANAIRDHGDVTINITALAASAATLLLAAAKQVIAKPGIMVMTHAASAMTLGNSDAHRATAAILDKINGEVVDLYFAAMSRRRPGTRPTDAAKLVASESWFSADEGVAIGLIDHAEAATFEMSGALVWASLQKFGDPRNLFKNPPASLLAMLKDYTMTTPNNAPANPAPAAPAATDITAQILDRAAAANLSLVQTREIVAKAGGSLDKARDLILEAAIAAAPGRDEPYRPGHVTLDDPATLHAAVRDTLLARMSGKPVAKDSPAAALMGRSLLDLGAMIVEANGGKIVSWHKDRLAEQIFAPTMRGQHSTSDFPGLTLDAGNRVLLDAYAAAASPLKTVARRRSAQDFRSIAALRLGEAPALLEVEEGGEVTYGTRAEAKESFKLRTFARIFSITRQALVNDDLQAFADMARAWGVAAANVEADQLYALISGDGVVMEDGKSLWHADHNNVAGIAAALGLDTLNDARMALRNTVGLDGVTPLNLVPKFLLVGPASETQAEKWLAANIAATVADDVNPFASKLTLLVEPRIADYAFFIFGDPAQAEVLAYANLGDAVGPQLATKEGWTILGQEFRAINDFGAGATGYRGAYKNAGAIPS
jgi:ATP-dependent protease ClpP protease subunit